MGNIAAKMITEGKMDTVKVDFKLILRSSL
jgi:hypothetical protein